MDYVCPAWRSAARAHVRRLPVLQSKRLRLATGAPWYVTGRYTRIWAFRCLPTTSEAWPRALTQKLPDVGNPLLRQLGRYLSWRRVGPVTWRENQGRQGTAGQSRPSPAMSKSTKRIALGADQPRALRLPWGFPWFSSVLRQMPGYSMQSRGTARTSLHQAWRFYLSAWQTSHNTSMRQSQSGLGTQAANHPKFITPILNPGQPGPSLWQDKSRPSAWLQNR